MKKNGKNKKSSTSRNAKSGNAGPEPAKKPQSAARAPLQSAARPPLPSAAPPPLPAAPVTKPVPENSASPAKPETEPASSHRPKKRRLPSAAGRKSADLKIPPILLEGDASAIPHVSGPGSRYALAPQPITTTPASPPGELPESYGTGRIFLAARDPRWLYASWDLTHEQQRQLNAASRDGHLVLRIFTGDHSTPVSELHVHPESNHWFVNVPQASARYHAELGFFAPNGSWQSVSISQSTFTPPDAPSPDLHAEFATIPPQVTFQEVVKAVAEIVEHKPSLPLLEAVALAAETQKHEAAAQPPPQAPATPPPPQKKVPESRTTTNAPNGAPPRAVEPPAALPIRIQPGKPWKPAQQKALRRLIHMDGHRRVWLGSIEITELVRRELEEEISSIAALEAKRMLAEVRPEELPFPGISSALGGELPRPRRFWFKVNAELIIYGATEPDAAVTIAGRPIKLRPDGTFSFRFSLPDGRYQLPAVATSGDGAEAREARLEFGRATEFRGRVEPHPQPPELRPPRPENVQ